MKERLKMKSVLKVVKQPLRSPKLAVHTINKIRKILETPPKDPTATKTAEPAALLEKPTKRIPFWQNRSMYEKTK